MNSESVDVCMQWGAYLQINGPKDQRVTDQPDTFKRSYNLPTIKLTYSGQNCCNHCFSSETCFKGAQA